MILIGPNLSVFSTTSTTKNFCFNFTTLMCKGIFFLVDFFKKYSRFSRRTNSARLTNLGQLLIVQRFRAGVLLKKTRTVFGPHVQLRRWNLFHWIIQMFAPCSYFSILIRNNSEEMIKVEKNHCRREITLIRNIRPIFDMVSEHLDF